MEGVPFRRAPTRYVGEIGDPKCYLCQVTSVWRSRQLYFRLKNSMNSRRMIEKAIPGRLGDFSLTRTILQERQKQNFR